MACSAQTGRPAGRAALFTLLALAGTGFVAVFYGGALWGRFLELETASEVRMDLYHEVWRMVTTQPWLGFGGGSFEQAFQLFHRPPVNADLVWDRAHNTYLTLWSELGIVFGSLPLLIAGALTWRAAVAFRASKAPDAAILA